MLKKIRELSYRYAIVSSLLIALLIVLLLNGVALFFRLLPDSLPFRYAEEVIGILYSVGIVLLLGFKNTFKTKGLFKGLLCSVVIIGVMLYSLGNFFSKAASNPDTVWASTGMIIFGLFHALVIGIREECFFRGAIQNILVKKYANSVKGVWISALIGSVFFALTHMLNLITGVNLLTAIAQTLSAVGSGLFFSAIYLRSGTIWAPVLVHALIDTAAIASAIFLTQTQTEAINDVSFGALVGVVIYIVPALFLLRPSKCKEIVARLQAEQEHTF